LKKKKYRELTEKSFEIRKKLFRKESFVAKRTVSEGFKRTQGHYT